MLGEVQSAGVDLCSTRGSEKKKNKWIFFFKSGTEPKHKVDVSKSLRKKRSERRK